MGIDAVDLGEITKLQANSRAARIVEESKPYVDPDGVEYEALPYLGPRAKNTLYEKGDRSWMEPFLKWYAVIGYVMPAAKKVGVSYTVVRKHIEKDPEFAARVEEAKEESIQRVEQALRTQAVVGKDVKAMALYLRAERPEKYRPQPVAAVQVNNSIGSHHSAKSAEEEKKRRIREMRQAMMQVDGGKLMLALADTAKDRIPGVDPSDRPDNAVDVEDGVVAGAMDASDAIDVEIEPEDDDDGPCRGGGTDECPTGDDQG